MAANDLSFLDLCDKENSYTSETSQVQNVNPVAPGRCSTTLDDGHRGFPSTLKFPAIFLPWTVISFLTQSKVQSVESLQWRHNGHDGVSNHQPHDCLLNSLFRRRSKKTSKLRVTGFCVGNSPVTGEFPARRAISAENASIWWRRHVLFWYAKKITCKHTWKNSESVAKHPLTSAP